MTINRPNRFTYALIFSVIWHLLVFGWAPKLSLTKGLNLGLGIKKPEPFKVKTISKQELAKYRRAGVKNGSLKPDRVLIKGKKAPTILKSKKPISLSSLSPKPKKVAAKRQQSKSTKKTVSTRVIRQRDLQSPLTINNKPIPTDSSYELNSMKVGVLKQLAASPDASPILKNAGFNINVEQPKGTPEDELNSAEKMYYSFQKRTFYTYINGYLKSYQKTVLKHPNLKTVLRNEKHLLKGRVIFDKLGNIMSIKILKSSPNDDIHELFEETLKEMRKLPNPPKDLLEDKEQFTIYYTLQIN